MKNHSSLTRAKTNPEMFMHETYNETFDYKNSSEIER